FVDQRPGSRLLIPLQQLKLGLAALIQHHDLSIKNRLMAEVLERVHDWGKATCKRELVAGIEAHLPPVYPGNSPVTVPLDLKEPVGLIEWLSKRRCQHRL